MEEKQITGENIIHALNFYKLKKGINGMVELASEMDYDINNLFEERWYPVELYTSLLENLEKKFEYKDFSISFRIGFDRSKKIGILRNSSEKVEPKLAFGKIKNNWWRFNNFARVELKEIDHNHLNIYLCDNIKHSLYCERMRGFFAGILREVCNQLDPKVNKAKCMCTGDNYCKFEASWELPEE